MKIISYLLRILLLSMILALIPVRNGISGMNGSNLQGHADNSLSSHEIQGFDLITPQSGWILIDQHLYWTEDAGNNWTNISPPQIGDSKILSSYFVDQNRGWVISNGMGAGGESFYILARTSNGGKRWRLVDLPLYQPGDVDAFPQAAFLFFIDRNTGWLVIRSASSSNFDNGVLFKTNDGGLTWTRLNVPFGEPVYFINKDVGWIAGGAAGDELYRTEDGGISWQPQLLLFQPASSIRYQNPQFRTSQIGILPVRITDERNSYLQVFFTEDGGKRWQKSNPPFIIQDIDPSVLLPFSMLGELNAMIIHPDTGLSFQTKKSLEFTVSSLQNPSIPSIVRLDMVSPEIGWAEKTVGQCFSKWLSNGTMERLDRRACKTDDQLLITHDGGRSWQMLGLPENYFIDAKIFNSPADNVLPSALETTYLSSGMGKRAFALVSQGFDKCEIPTLDKLQVWIKDSPYNAINLYIGGAARSCSNLALSATYISQLSQQGWKFIPTWVGPQASCYSRPIPKMSGDPIVSRLQGIAEANAAIEKAYDLDLTLTNKSGAVIYYDLERYDMTNSSCHQAARAFIEGWVSQMRSRGNIPGVYSSGPILNDYFSLSEKPEVIWPAHWISSTYSPSATVWNVYGLTNSYWGNQERIRQYAGGHSETWGTVSITIDSDVIDGLVAFGPLEGDYNDDGYPDIYSVQKVGSQSGSTEVFILDGKSSFNTSLSHHITPLRANNDQWVFDMADFNNDGKSDLYAIHHYGTQSGKIEIQILNGVDTFQSALLTVTTGLSQTLPGAWVYKLGNFDQDGIPDLYAIDRDSQSQVRVSVLSGISGYQTQFPSVPTLFGRAGTTGGWAFVMGDYNQDNITDLAAINKSFGSGSMTEISILNGTDYFQSFLLTTPTGLLKTGSDNGWVFNLRDHNYDGIPDLFAINRITGVNGKTEVHILDGAAMYQNFLLSSPTALLHTGSDCSWDFLTGQCYTTNPVIRFWYYFPVSYR